MARVAGVAGEALRCLWRGRRYAALAVLVVALGVAAVTMAFAVVKGIILRPLPYRDAGRLVVALDEVRAADYRDIRARTHVFSETTFAGLYNGIIRSPGGPRQVHMMLVSPNFFSFMGLDPVVGRAFLPGEYAAGQDGVALLSDRLRHSLLGADAQLLGHTIELDSRPRSIVGVAPPSFTFRLYWPSDPVDLWLPLTLTPLQLNMRGETGRSMESMRQEAYPYYTFFLARLKQGVTVQRAQEELDLVLEGLIAEHPEDKSLQGLQLWKLKDTRVRLACGTLWPLFGLCSAFLVFACFSIAGLSLARRLSRGREFAVRAALGAGPARLVALSVAEGFWIGIAGALCGALLSFGALRWFRASIPGTLLPRVSGVSLDWEALAFAAATALCAAIVAGAAPAVISRNLAPATVLVRAGSSSAALGGRRRFGGRALILVQCVIATALLGAAGLMLSGSWRLSHAPLGFQPERVIEAEIQQTTTGGQAWNQTKNSQLWRSLLAQAVNLPGVEAAALTGSSFGLVARSPFRTPSVGNGTGGGTTAWFDVSPSYFRTLGIPLLTGRDFNAEDSLGASPPQCRELGIRYALGASRAGLVGAALWRSALVGAIGAAGGLAVVEVLKGTLQAWLFGLRPVGMLALTGAAAVVFLSCLFGTFLPTASALRDEPTRVLRLE